MSCHEIYFIVKSSVMSWDYVVCHEVVRSSVMTLDIVMYGMCQ